MQKINIPAAMPAAAFLGGVPDAVAYNARGAEEDHRRVPLVMDRGTRRVIVMPINPDEIEGTYNPAGAVAFADMAKNKARAAAVVFVVVLPEGVHVFKNKTDAEQLASRYGATVAESVVM